MGDVGHVAELPAGFEQIAVKCRIQGFGDPNDWFGFEILAIYLRGACQRMVLGQCNDQLVVPNTLGVETLSVRRQLDDSRLECSV